MKPETLTLPGAIEIAPQDIRTASTCCHHWLIETPNGPISRGVCKFCSEIREFHNSFRDLDLMQQYGARRFYRAKKETSSGFRKEKERLLV